MSEKVEVPKELLEKLAKDPRYIEKAQKSYELDSFKKKYQVEHASPLKCPACSQYGMGGGTLWGPEKGTRNKFVCRRCRLEWVVECITKPNERLFLELKESRK